MEDRETTNVHLISLVNDLLWKARMMDDPAALDALKLQILPKIERAILVKNEWMDIKTLVARFNGFFPSENVVRNHIQRGTGPAYYKVGNHRQSPIRFHVTDVEAWILRHKVLTRRENQLNLADRQGVTE